MNKIKTFFSNVYSKLKNISYLSLFKKILIYIVLSFLVLVSLGLLANSCSTTSNNINDNSTIVSRIKRAYDPNTYHNISDTFDNTNLQYGSIYVSDSSFTLDFQLFFNSSMLFNTTIDVGPIFNFDFNVNNCTLFITHSIIVENLTNPPPISAFGSGQFGALTNKGVNGETYQLTFNTDDRFYYGGSEFIHAFSTIYNYSVNNSFYFSSLAFAIRPMSNAFYGDGSQHYFNVKILVDNADISSKDIYDSGYNAGYNTGKTDGYNDGYTNGYKDGEDYGYNTGYNAGSSDSNNFVSGLNNIFATLIDTPFNIISTFLNFDILGINIFTFFSSILTLLVVIYIIKRFL